MDDSEVKVGRYYINEKNKLVRVYSAESGHELGTLYRTSDGACHAGFLVREAFPFESMGMAAKEMNSDILIDEARRAGLFDLDK